MALQPPISFPVRCSFCERWAKPTAVYDEECGLHTHCMNCWSERGCVSCGITEGSSDVR